MGNPADTGIVITMAGAGSRFVHAGYTVPKYQIEAHGRTLFSWSMESLRSFIDSGSPFLFVARGEPGTRRFIEAQCRSLGIRSYRVLELDSITDGQATTALLAGELWDDLSRPLAIYNIDTYVNPAALPVSAVRGNGWIPCFPGEGDKWSFAAADSRGRVTEVREKNRISPCATVGLYWFDSFTRYAAAYAAYYADPRHIEAKERYIAPLYNQLIAETQNVYLHNVPARDVYPLGTPEDVELFARRPLLDVLHMASG
jgi:hypothetical protein